jgi:hypothetical protein
MADHRPGREAPPTPRPSEQCLKPKREFQGAVDLLTGYFSEEVIKERPDVREEAARPGTVVPFPPHRVLSGERSVTGRPGPTPHMALQAGRRESAHG